MDFLTTLLEVLVSIFNGKKQDQPTTQPSTQPIVQAPQVQPAVTPVPQHEVVYKTSDPISSYSVPQKFAAPAKTLEAARARYGEITDDLKWSNETKWLAMFQVPAGFEGWINTASGRPTTHIYCNKDMHAPLQQALKNISDRGLVKQLKTFDGAYMIRAVRGQPNSLSTHSYALAIDVNSSTNKLGTPGDMSPELGQCFLDAGLSWGRHFHRQDAMHFSFAWE